MMPKVIKEPKKFTPEWFRFFRYVRGELTMRQAAALAGVTHVSWFHWEKGQTVPRKSRLKLIDKYLAKERKSVK